MTLRRYWSTASLRSLPDQAAMHARQGAPDHPLGARAPRRGGPARLDANPDAMRTRRETVEHPFGTIKARMGATYFLTKRLPNVAAEMALHVLAYNLTRVMNIVGRQSLIAAIGVA